MNQRLKIMYVMPTLDKGGAERFLTDLLTHLDQELFAPELLLFKRGGAWLAEIEARGIPVRILHKRFRFDPYNFWQIFQAIRRAAPDIVHTQLGGDIYGRLAAKLAQVPVIMSSEQNVNPDEGRLYNWLKSWTSNFCQMTVAITQAVSADAQERYKLPAERIRIIPNGLDTSKFSPRESGGSEQAGGAVFGTIGRLSPQKGHSYLVAAWQKLAAEQVQCLIAGTGPLQADLEAQIAQAGLSKQVKLVGPVDDVPAFLRSLDAFVFPSVWEGQGIVLMEAALAGLPIVASAVDGIKEVLSEDTAWLVPAQDVAALAARLQWLLANLDSPEVRAKSQRLREKIIARFDIWKITKEYQALYGSLIKEHYENIAG